MAKSMAGSAPAAPTRSAKPFNSYLLNKCIVGYGIINGIINAVIFYLMHLSEPELLFLSLIHIWSRVVRPEGPSGEEEL